MNQVKFVHVHDQKCTPISVSAKIYEGNPALTSIKKTIHTQIREKKIANKLYNNVAKNSLTAVKMENMAKELSENFLKFSVCIFSAIVEKSFLSVQCDPGFVNFFVISAFNILS